MHTAWQNIINLAPILFPLCGACLLVFILVWAWHRKYSGKRGEKKVARILHTLPKEYIVLNDLLLPTSYGTTQIDHVVVSLYGVFVIETKDYSGIISGGEFEETWTKNVYGNKYPMPNPIRQNKVHIAAVAKVLSQRGIGCKIYSIVAFSENADIMASASDCEIIYFHQLRKAICHHANEQISQEQVSAIVEGLNAENIIDTEQRKQHIKSVRANVRERQLKVANGICPRCGGLLVACTGRYGNFYGCSNYPKCRFIQRL